MDFVTSHFGKVNLWPVEHIFQHICHQFEFAGCNSKPIQKWWQICWKSVPLVKGSSFRNDLLQNPYFKRKFCSRLSSYYRSRMPRDFEVGDNPFALTAEEIKSLEPGYKKPKNKVIICYLCFLSQFHCKK